MARGGDVAGDWDVAGDQRTSEAWVRGGRRRGDSGPRPGEPLQKFASDPLGQSLDEFRGRRQGSSAERGRNKPSPRET